MAIYTFWGNHDKGDGTAELNIASGPVELGKSGDFTAAEYQLLSVKHILVAGSTGVSDSGFAFQQKSKAGVQTAAPGGGAMHLGSGATSLRPNPTTVGVGSIWYDTTIVKPIFCDGTVWRDANGAAV